MRYLFLSYRYYVPLLSHTSGIGNRPITVEITHTTGWIIRRNRGCKVFGRNSGTARRAGDLGRRSGYSFVRVHRRTKPLHSVSPSPRSPNSINNIGIRGSVLFHGGIKCWCSGGRNGCWQNTGRSRSTASPSTNRCSKIGRKHMRITPDQGNVTCFVKQCDGERSRGLLRAKC